MVPVASLKREREYNKSCKLKLESSSGSFKAQAGVAIP